MYGSREAVTEARGCRRVIIEKERLIVDPEEEVYQNALRRMREESDRRQKERTAAAEKVTQTRICANISGPRDIPALAACGADGVGLFRSEFLYLDHDAAPSEEEQYEAYRSVAEAMQGKETVIRTMDLGSDKKAGWLSLPDEKNPALGCRGLRLSLKERDLFRTQLRALLRAGVHGDIKIMVPMVTSVREVEEIRACLTECAGELSKEGIQYRIPPVGIMVETPAAALIADQLAEKVDFFSIGTNDLTQYTLALDREAQGLEEYYDPLHEAVLGLIRMTVSAAHEKNIPVSVCGELAGDPRAVGLLVEAGVDKLSVSPGKVEATKLLVIEAEEQLFRRRKEEQEIRIAAPADGRLIPMEEIPDPVFASGTMGECTGILPENGTIYAPCDGIVSGVAETGHAVTFTTADGREILVHVGIDTVTLGGRAFSVLVRKGDSVSTGDIVLKADLDVIRQAGLSTMVITACLKS